MLAVMVPRTSHTAQQFVERLGGQQQRRQLRRGVILISTICHVRARP
jgi:hypothetical protein